MSLLSVSKRTLAVAGLVGLAAAASTTQASAFGLFFGGGPFGGGIHLGGLFGGGPRFVDGPRFRDFGPRRAFCRFERCFRDDRPIYYVRPTYTYHRPVYHPRPVYQAAAPAPVYRAPAPVYARAYQASAPVSRAPVDAPQPTSVSVVFQPTATTADVTAFMKAYNVTVSTGPDASGTYRVQISTNPVTQDQLNQIVESMRSQTNVVSQVGA